MRIHAFALLVGLTASNLVHADAPAAPADITAQKLKTLNLSLNFYQATIDQAVYFLHVESKRMDPAHMGFNIVVSPSAAAAARPVTTQGNAVTFEQALGGVCAAAGVKYQLDGGVILILSPTENPVEAKPDIAPGQAAQATMQLLQATVIDKVNFEKLDIAAVLKYLTLRSRLLDPNRVGVDFIVADFAPSDNIHRLVTLTLEGLPLSAVLKCIAGQTNLNYAIGDETVTFKP